MNEQNPKKPFKMSNLQFWANLKAHHFHFDGFLDLKITKYFYFCQFESVKFAMLTNFWKPKIYILLKNKSFKQPYSNFDQFGVFEMCENWNLGHSKFVSLNSFEVLTLKISPIWSFDKFQFETLYLTKMNDALVCETFWTWL